MATPLPYTETFTGTNGTTWSSVWTITGAGSNTISSNAGLVTTANTSNASQRADMTGVNPSVDSEVLLTFTTPTITSGPAVTIMIGSDNSAPTGLQANNCYYFNFFCSSATPSAEMGTYSGGVLVGTPVDVGITLSANTAYKLRFNKTGTTYSFRWWLASGAEPGTWTGTGTVGASLAAGNVGIDIEFKGTVGGAVQTVTFDDITVIDPSAPALPAAPTAPTALAGDTSATVNAVASTGTGITAYTVTATPGGITASASYPSVLVSGLTNGVPYTFTMHATNSAGDGPESTVTNSVTPFSKQALPYSDTFTGTNGSTWASVWNSATPGTNLIQSNAGVMTASGTGTSQRADSIGLSNSYNADFTCAFLVPTLGSASDFIFIHLNSDNGRNTNTATPYYGYGLGWDTSATPTLAIVIKNNGLSNQVLSSVVSLTANTYYSVRFRRAGLKLYYKYWLTSSGEPASWLNTYTLTDDFAPGVASMSFVNNTGALPTMTIDNVTISDPTYQGSATIVWMSTF